MGHGWVGIPVGSSLKGKMLLFPAIFFTKWLNKKIQLAFSLWVLGEATQTVKVHTSLTVTSFCVSWLFLTCLGDRLNSCIEYNKRVKGTYQRENLTWSLRVWVTHKCFASTHLLRLQWLRFVRFFLFETNSRICFVIYSSCVRLEKFRIVCLCWIP